MEMHSVRVRALSNEYALQNGQEPDPWVGHPTLSALVPMPWVTRLELFQYYNREWDLSMIGSLFPNLHSFSVEWPTYQENLLEAPFWSRLTSLVLTGPFPLDASSALWPRLTALRKLTLACNACLAQTPASFGQLRGLTHLTLKRVLKLPPSLPELVGLTFLSIQCQWAGYRDTQNLETLTECELPRLTTLLLDRAEVLPRLSCTNLQNLKIDSYFLRALPQHYCQLSRLRHLSLSHNTNLTALPEDLGNLLQLVSLNISYCRQLTSLPDSVGRLRRLRRVYARECFALTAFPPGMAPLTHLDVSACVSLKYLPPLAGETLVHLAVDGCKSLCELPRDMSLLACVSRLELRSARALTALPASVALLRQIQVLSLEDCTKLVALPAEMMQLHTLLQLNLRGCLSLTALPDHWDRLPNLMSLNLEFCQAIESLPASIGRLRSLRVLQLACCTALRSLPPTLGQLPSLFELDVSHCTALPALPPNLPVSLNHLNVTGCIYLPALPSELGRLNQLLTLGWSSCSSLMQLPAYHQLARLTTLDLSQNFNLESLPSPMPPHLRTIILDHCESLTQLPSSLSVDCRTLQYLDLSYCLSLRALPNEMDQVNNVFFFCFVYIFICDYI